MNKPVKLKQECPLLPCPSCGDPDELTLDSSSSAEASWIDCHSCDYKFQRKCDEETLVERWNKLDRAQPKDPTNDQ